MKVIMTIAPAVLCALGGFALGTIVTGKFCVEGGALLGLAICSLILYCVTKGGAGE